MSPNRFAELFEAYQDGTLDDAGARELHEALVASPELLNEMLDEIGTAQVLSRLSNDVKPAIAPRVMAALRRDSQKIALRERVMSQLDTRAARPIQRRRSSRKVLRPARRKVDIAPIWAIGAAACLLLVVGLAMTSKQISPTPSDLTRNPVRDGKQPEGSVADIQARLEEADRRRMAIEADLRQIQSQQAALTPPAEPAQKESTPTHENSRSRVLAELDARRISAEKELERANQQRREASHQLAEAARATNNTPSLTAEIEREPLGRIAYTTPDSVLIRNGIREPAVVGKAVQERDQFETTANGMPERKARLALTLFNGVTVDLSDATTFTVLDSGNADLQRGLIYASVEKDTSASYKAGEYKWLIRTPSGSIGVTGTRFDLRAETNETRIQMEEGSVNFFNARGSQTVGAFKTSSARPTTRPSQPAPFAPESLWRGRSQPLPGLSVQTFTLADCNTAKALPGFERIGELTEIRLSTLNSRNFTLVARTFPEEIGSVTFTVNGALQQVESVFPYCISTDTDGHARPWDLKPGTYEIVATPYTGLKATGTAGQPLKITLKVLE